MRILATLVVLTLLVGILVAQEETEALSDTEVPQEAGDAQDMTEGPESHDTETKMPTAAPVKYGLKPMWIINAPLRACPDGQRRDSSGRCRSPLGE